MVGWGLIPPRVIHLVGRLCENGLWGRIGVTMNPELDPSGILLSNPYD